MNDHGEVNLFVKESGSMNIAVFPPQHFFIYPDPDGKVSDEVLYRQDNCLTSRLGVFLTSYLPTVELVGRFDSVIYKYVRLCCVRICKKYENIKRDILPITMTIQLIHSLQR